MRFLVWAIGIMSVVAFISVVADASEKEVAAWIAPKLSNRLPASNPEPEAPVETHEVLKELPKELEGASIEVGFSQEDEPEPHLLAIASEGTIKLFELPEKNSEQDKKKASAPSQPTEGAKSTRLDIPVFVKRMRQLESENFFTAAQPRRKKARCRDEYVIRVKRDGKFRERRGCSNQTNDPYAGLSQNIFRDAFLAWSKAQNR